MTEYPTKKKSPSSSSSTSSKRLMMTGESTTANTTDVAVVNNITTDRHYDHDGADDDNDERYEYEKFEPTHKSSIQQETTMSYGSERRRYTTRTQSEYLSRRRSSFVAVQPGDKACGCVNLALEQSLRIIFCFPKDFDDDDDDNDNNTEQDEEFGMNTRDVNSSAITHRVRSTTRQALNNRNRRRCFHILAHGFHVLELADFVMDFYFVVTRLFPNGHVAEGVVVIVGMFIAWGVSYYGQCRLTEGGIKYTPFGIPFDKFYHQMPMRRKIHPMLFTISFTEMAAFFFEDGPFLAAIQSLDLYEEQDNTFDTFLLNLTLIKAIFAGMFSTFTALATLNCHYCSEQKCCSTTCCCCCCANPQISDRMEQHGCCKICGKCCSGCCSLLPFLYVFTIWTVGLIDIAWVLSWEPGYEDLFPINFIGRTVIYWIGGAYCVFCLVWYRRRKKTPSSDQGMMTSESGIVVHGATTSSLLVNQIVDGEEPTQSEHSNKKFVQFYNTQNSGGSLTTTTATGVTTTNSELLRRKKSSDSTIELPRPPSLRLLPDDPSENGEKDADC